MHREHPQWCAVVRKRRWGHRRNNFTRELKLMSRGSIKSRITAELRNGRSSDRYCDFPSNPRIAQRHAKNIRMS